MNELTALLLLFAFAGCETQSDDSYVVKVGTARLTEQMINDALPKELRNNSKAIENYMQNWIETEILYQKAVSLGIDREEAYKAELESIKKKLLAEILIQQEISDRIIISEEGIKSYYEENQEVFTRKKDEVKLNYFITDDAGRATDFRFKTAGLSGSRENRFLEIANSVAAADDRLGTTDFLGADEMSELMAQAVFAGNLDPRVLSPFQVPEGTCFLRIVDSKEGGSIRSLEEVSHEIEAILKSMDRERQYESFLSKAKAEMDIQFAIEPEN